jgi:predicted metal-binding membrane protein
MFITVAALLFGASAAATIAWCTSMSDMPQMLMPGGWSMTMTWMRMPGQTWPSTAASFLRMWIVMMIAMMLPALLPMLLRDRAALRAAGQARVEAFTALAGAGYFTLWAVLGVVIYPIGVGLAELTMRQPALSRAVPIVTAAILVIAIALQFTAWKAERLACCRTSVGELPQNATGAWRHGMRLGYDCLRCCANLMAILLILGVMDLRVMAAVTAAITFERLAPVHRRVLRAGHAVAQP